MSINDLQNTTEKENILADVYQKLAEAENQSICVEIMKLGIDI